MSSAKPTRKVALVIGTRPEAIKLAPVYRRLQASPEFEPLVIATSQHREMLVQAFDIFGIRPDYDLDVMTDGQTMAALAARILERLEPVLARERPAWVCVQGDTASTFCGALAGFYQHIPLAHIEAGLRTFDLRNPFPEEANRRFVSVIADLHFAPTDLARDHLIREGVPADRILVTGNTGIDALHEVLQIPYAMPPILAAALSGSGPRLMLTAHRRENHGAPLQDICESIRRLCERLPELRVLFPVHPNPAVQSVVNRVLSDVPGVHRLPPLGYQDFAQAMSRVDLILTDSGGLQEEAPSLGKPVLVMRNTTERPEGLEAGTARLVGTDPDRIVAEVQHLLSDTEAYRAMARSVNPYGDGHAAERIVEAIARMPLPDPGL